MNSTKYKGFTLIELLVVIAIIAILAAILFPVFATAREKARQTSCSSNEKQIGLGILQYTQDYDESYPIAIDGYPSAAYKNTGWVAQVFPYIKSAGVWACPDNSLTTGTLLTYGMNLNLRGSGSTGSQGANVTYGTSTHLTSPSSTVMVFELYPKVGTTYFTLNLAQMGTFCSVPGTNPNGQDCFSNFGNGGDNLGSGWINGNLYATGVMGVPSRAAASYLVPGVHSGGSNFLMADGHVKWLPPTVVSPGNTPTTATCNQDACGVGTSAGTAALGNTFAVTFSPL